MEHFIQALEEVLSQPATVVPLWARTLCYGLQASIVAALLFYGTWLDSLISFFLGSVVGAIILYFVRYARGIVV